MRFEFLLATIAQGPLAPLLLMAGGFLLAAGGAAVLFWRRKRSAGAESAVEDAFEADGTPLEGADTEAAPPPAPAKTGRRRSLVSGAERDEGTPSGEFRSEEEPDEDHAEPEIEEAGFTGHDNTADEAEPAFEEYAEELSEDEYEPVVELAELEEPEPELVDEASVGAAAAASDATGAARDDDEEPVPAEVAAARIRPIVFRQFMPQSPGKDGLSFYGGQPIGPEDFQWPRARGAEDGGLLQFVMQWDCAQLSEQDATGLLPQDGVLYCFANFDHDSDEKFIANHSFIHHRGAARAWNPVAIPDDAGPNLDESSNPKLSGHTEQIENAEDHTPRSLPRFPFTPVAFDCPDAGEGQDSYWSDESAASALLEVQKSVVAANAADVDTSSLDRPFPSFPHDFGAIRVVASHMIEALTNPEEFAVETPYSDLSEDDRNAQFTTWRDEAKELYALGTQRPESHKLDQNIADDIWQWFEDRCEILGAIIPALIEEAVNLSLSVGSEALGDVPAEWIDKAMRAHALAIEDGNGVSAPAPAHMFGPSSNSGGEDKALESDHILLLELPSGGGPKHHFGGRTLQYWITPDDLAAGDFDAVKAQVVAPQS